MASVAFELFLPEILPEVQGVPYPTAVNAVRNACYDFCARSFVWQETLEGEAYTAGEPEYTLSAPTGATIVGVSHVTVDGTRSVYPWTLEDLIAKRPNWRTHEGVIEGYYQPSANTIRFVAVPDSDGAFDASISLAPSRTASNCAGFLFDRFLEPIKYGALWKLKAMHGQPWADPSGATYYERLFSSHIGGATIQRNRGVSGAQMRVQASPFI